MNSDNSSQLPSVRLFYVEPVPEFLKAIERSPWRVHDRTHDKETAEILVSSGLAKEEWLSNYDPILVILLARNASSAAAAESILRGEIARAGLEPDCFLGFSSVALDFQVQGDRLNDYLDSAFTVPDGEMPNKRRRLPSPMIDYYVDLPKSMQAYRWASLYGASWQREIYALGFAPIFFDAKWSLLCAPRSVNWVGVKLPE